MQFLDTFLLSSFLASLSARKLPIMLRTDMQQGDERDDQGKSQKQARDLKPSHYSYLVRDTPA